MLKVGIVIVNWKQADMTIKIVNSLSHITHPNFNYHLLVVDNASPDSSFLQLSKSLKSNKLVSIVKSDQNTGFTGGNNIGLKYFLDKNFDYILLINNDVLVDPNFLIPLVDTLNQKLKVGAVNPKIYFAPGFEFHKNRYHSKDKGKVIWAAGGHIDWENIIGSNIGIDQVDTGQYNQPTFALDFVTGCCCLLRSSALKQVGLLDSRYFMYFEDADLSQRLIKKGWQLMYQPSSVIWHQNAGSSTAGGSLQQYFLTRNRLLFGLKFAKTNVKFALLRQAVIQLLTSPYPYIKLAVKDFFFNRWYQGSWQ